MSATINLEFSMDDLSFADLIAIERATGEKVTMSALQDPGIALVAALMWIGERRNNPDLGFDEFAARPMMKLEIGDPKAETAVPEAGASLPTTSQGG